MCLCVCVCMCVFVCVCVFMDCNPPIYPRFLKIKGNCFSVHARPYMYPINFPIHKRNIARKT
jgi:hypothetical protein